MHGRKNALDVVEVVSIVYIKWNVNESNVIKRYSAFKITAQSSAIDDASARRRMKKRFNQ